MIEKYIPFARDFLDKIEIPNLVLEKHRNNNKLSGLITQNLNGALTKNSLIKGIGYGISETLNKGISIRCFWNGVVNDYWFYESLGGGFVLVTFDMGQEIEFISWNDKGELQVKNSLSIDRRHFNVDAFMSEYPEIIEHIDEVAHGQLWSSLIEVTYVGCKWDMELVQRLTWAYERKLRMKDGLYTENSDFLPYYIQQNEMSNRVIKEDNLPEKINFIGGVDVAYNEVEQRMIGAIVVLNSSTMEVVEESFHEMDITFPYIPGLFSFREIPPLVIAFNKLVAKPEIIICDGHGIAHPKKIGMATHLGIELNIPTIGCAKNRLVGVWQKEKLGNKRGSTESLIWEGEEVGKVLRTQNDVKPVFVSIGHKISLESATSWVLKLCTEYRMPETTRKSDQLVNRLMKERLEMKFLDRDEE